MKNSTKYIQFKAIILVFVFISPMLIQTTHFFYIHHEHSSIPSSNKLAYSEYHPECPICAYEAVDEIEIYTSFTLGKPKFISILFFIHYYATVYIYLIYTFNLRASPVSNIFKEVEKYY